MKVFADYHHGNLYYSLHLLFEKRLRYELYRPIGKEWLTQGYWKIAEPYGNADDTINQYLGTQDRNWDAYKSLNGGCTYKDGVYSIYDPENAFTHKAITLKTFKEMKFDYIVSSYPTHDWEDLLRFQKDAKYIVQLGNENQTTKAKNILCSVLGFTPHKGQNVMNYHQEFDLTDYQYVEPVNHTKISSFVVLLPERELFLKYKEALYEMSFKAYGPGAIDGIIGDGKGISAEMRNSAFGWHVKPQDGFGHVIHKWYASGRPVITRGSYYAGKLAGQLLVDGETCIDLDAHSFEENLRLIRYWAYPENHKRMCGNAIKRFREIVNFEKEAEDIKLWLSNVGK